jgi:hypothetical protein
MSLSSLDASRLKAHEGGRLKDASAPPDAPCETAPPSLTAEELVLIRRLLEKAKQPRGAGFAAALRRRDAATLLAGLAVWSLAAYGVWQLLV